MIFLLCVLPHNFYTMYIDKYCYNKIQMPVKALELKITKTVDLPIHNTVQQVQRAIKLKLVNVLD